MPDLGPAILDFLTAGRYSRFRALQVRMRESFDRFRVARKKHDRAYRELTSAVASLEKARGEARQVLRQATVLHRYLSGQVAAPDRLPPPPDEMPTKPGWNKWGAATVGAGGVAVPTVTTAAAWNAVGLLGAASTGTPIASLGGVAAYNATLAWFGCGAVAFGGGGMALGLVVLVALALVSMVAFLVPGMLVFLDRTERDWTQACDRLDSMAIEAKQWRSQCRQLTEQAVMHQEQLESVTEACSSSIRALVERLYPRGVLSRLWRWLRFSIVGARFFASDEEVLLIQELDPLLHRLDQLLALSLNGQKPG